MAKIKLTTPDGSKLEFELTVDRVTIGRADDNDIVVPDGSVSSRHGEILLKGESVELVDLGSTNGTHVGGARVERATIAPGGTFKLGNVEGVLLGEAVALQPVEEPTAEEEAPAAEAPPPRSRGVSLPSRVGASPAVAVTAGLGSTPCPARQRKGFGAKSKEKDKLASLFSAIGIISLLVCAAAAFLIFKMGA